MRGRGGAPRLRTVRGRAGREAGKGHGGPIRGSMRGRGNALRLRTVRGRAGREAGTVCRRASWGQWGIEFLKKGHGGAITGRGIV